MTKTRTLSQASQSSLERQVSKQGHRNNDLPFVIKRVHEGQEYNIMQSVQQLRPMALESEILAVLFESQLTFSHSVSPQ